MREHGSSKTREHKAVKTTRTTRSRIKTISLDNSTASFSVCSCTHELARTERAKKKMRTEKRNWKRKRRRKKSAHTSSHITNATRSSMINIFLARTFFFSFFFCFQREHEHFFFYFDLLLLFARRSVCSPSISRIVLSHSNICHTFWRHSFALSLFVVLIVCSSTTFIPLLLLFLFQTMPSSLSISAWSPRPHNNWRWHT